MFGVVSPEVRSRLAVGLDVLDELRFIDAFELVDLSLWVVHNQMFEQQQQLHAVEWEKSAIELRTVIHSTFDARGKSKSNHNNNKITAEELLNTLCHVRDLRNDLVGIWNRIAKKQKKKLTSATLAFFQQGTDSGEIPYILLPERPPDNLLADVPMYRYADWPARQKR